MEDRTEIAVVADAPFALAARGIDAKRVVASFLSGRSPNTLAAYRADLRAFQEFIGARDLDETAQFLLGRGHGEANAIALEYRAHMAEQGLAPNTVNRRLASLRSLVTLAQTLGLIAWELQAPNVKAVTYRDTRGPGCDGVVRILAAVAAKRGPKAVRDRAILSLLFDLALRRGEVVSLDIEHLDLERSTVAVLGKGRTARELLTLPDPTKAALAAWTKNRGAQAGPLFINFDRARKGERLTGRSIHRLVKKLGAQAGLTVRPHGLRHASITAALDLTAGDVRAVQRFSRHRSLATLIIYDDNRQDLGGRVARMVAGKVAGEGAA